MPATTRVLHVEDEVTDSDLVSVWLQEAGLDWEVVRVDSDRRRNDCSCPMNGDTSTIAADAIPAIRNCKRSWT